VDPELYVNTLAHAKAAASRDLETAALAGSALPRSCGDPPALFMPELAIYLGVGPTHARADADALTSIGGLAPRAAQGASTVRGGGEVRARPIGVPRPHSATDGSQFAFGSRAHVPMAEDDTLRSAELDDAHAPPARPKGQSAEATTTPAGGSTELSAFAFGSESTVELPSASPGRKGIEQGAGLEERAVESLAALSGADQMRGAEPAACLPDGFPWDGRLHRPTVRRASPPPSRAPLHVTASSNRTLASSADPAGTSRAAKKAEPVRAPAAYVPRHTLRRPQPPSAQPQAKSGSTPVARSRQPATARDTRGGLNERRGAASNRARMAPAPRPAHEMATRLDALEQRIAQVRASVRQSARVRALRAPH
jgi:hypothetical protein